jgi:gephyrin
MSSSTKLKAAILVVSDTASKDPSTDKCIPTLQSVFADLGNDQWEVCATEIVSDSVVDIQRKVTGWIDGEEVVNLIVTSGGTGFAVRDLTPEVCICVWEVDEEV